MAPDDDAVFRHQVRVRYNECDAQGVVFNANYLVFFDVALTELARARFGSFAALHADGADLMLVRSGLDYRASATNDDLLTVELRTGAIGTTSLRLHGRILRDDDLLTEAELHYVAIDPQTHRKRPVPDLLRRALGG